MAGWDTKTVDEVVTKIRSKKFVLPSFNAASSGRKTP